MPASVSTARLQPPAAAEPEGASRSEEGWLGFMETMQIVVSSWDKALVVASIVTSSLFVLVLVFQVLATGAARKAAEAAKQAAEAATASADEAKRSNDRAQQEQSMRIRPWVGFGFPYLDHVTDEVGALIVARDPEMGLVNVPPVLGNNWRFVFHFPMTNYGEYPAAAMNVTNVGDFDLEKVEAFLRSHIDLGHSLLIPKQTDPSGLIMTTELYRRLQRSDESFYFGVSTRYLDRESNGWFVDAVFKHIRSEIAVVRQSVKSISNSFSSPSISSNSASIT